MGHPYSCFISKGGKCLCTCFINAMEKKILSITLFGYYPTLEKRRGSSLQEKELISSLYAIRDALISLVKKSTGVEGETKLVKSLQTDEEIGEG